MTRVIDMAGKAFSNWSRAHVEHATAQLHDSPAWSAFRRKAFAAFESLPFENATYGLDIRSDTSRLDWNALLFDTSPTAPFSHDLGQGAVMCDLSTAFARFPAQVEAHLCKQLRLEEKMEALHATFLSHGVFIYLPPHAKLLQPIVLSDVLGKYSRLDHVLVLAEEGSSASILQEIHSGSTSPPASPSASTSAPVQPIFHSSVMEVVARAHASIRIGKLQDLPASGVFHFSMVRADVGEGASVHMEWAEFGAEFGKSEYASSLLAPHASSSNVGVMLLSASQQLDAHQSVRHIAPRTRSSLLSRGCLGGQSKCIYRGLIRMEKSATMSKGKQACDLLLLSPQAEADPVPALEILNSDVSCSHAATVGRLDEEKLFYIASRGVSDAVARSMVIAGFYEHALAHFSMPELKAKCQSLVQQRLGLDAYSFAGSPPLALQEVKA